MINYKEKYDIIVKSLLYCGYMTLVAPRILNLIDEEWNMLV